MTLCTTSGCHKFPFGEKFKILGYALNRQGKSHDAIEEIMQSAHEAFWKDILKNRKQRCSVEGEASKTVDHVYAVFAFGSENRSWTVLTLDKINGWETKTVLRLFHFNRHKEETWVDCHTRTCNMARKIWIQMGLPFLYEVIAENMWRAMGWACDERSTAVIDSPNRVYRWRCTRWWRSLKTEMLERFLKIIQYGSTSGDDTNVETCGIKSLRTGQVRKNG